MSLQGDDSVARLPFCLSQKDCVEDTAVSDDDVHVFVLDDDGSPSKRRKVPDMDAICNSFDVRLYIEALKGGIEVIHCERFNGDSASQLIRIRNALEEGNEDLMRMGIRSVAERAQKLPSGEAVLVKNKDSYEGRIYNKLVLLRFVDSTGKASRKCVLDRLAKFMNGETERLVRDKEVKANQPKWRVGKSFDRTPSDPDNFRKLDELVHPTFVVKVVAEAYTSVGPAWGVENAALAALFFSQPHAKATRDALFNE